jgi:hypothetical protein
MSYLAYGILPEQKLCRCSLPRGPQGEPLSAVGEDGLAIVFARAATAAARPAVPDLLTYAQVIESLHQRSAVLPMRYGCLFDGEDQLRDFLRKRHAGFQTQLGELEGCSEWTLRMMSLDSGEGSSEPKPAVVWKTAGAAYLAARRARYLAKEHQRSTATQLQDTMQQAFEGLFRACRPEQTAANGRCIASVHFLVHGDFTEPFRAACQRFRRTTLPTLRLSGPWPLYNFANCAACDCE